MSYYKLDWQYEMIFSEYVYSRCGVQATDMQHNVCWKQNIFLKLTTLKKYGLLGFLRESLLFKWGIFSSCFTAV